MRNAGEIDPEKMIADNNAAVGFVSSPAPDPLDGVLLVMAEDAFEVLNWARRLGLKREAQCDQVVSAFKKTLAETKCAIVPTSIIGK